MASVISGQMLGRIWARRSATQLGGLHALRCRVGVLAEELDPLGLDAPVVLGGFHQLQEAIEVPSNQCWSLGLAIRPSSSNASCAWASENMSVVKQSPEMLERLAQRPESAVPTGHRGRSGHQEAVLALEWLRPIAGCPIDRVLQHTGQFHLCVIGAMAGFLYGAQLLVRVVRLVGSHPFLRSTLEPVVGAFLLFAFSAVGFVITFLAARVLIWLLALAARNGVGRTHMSGPLSGIG